MTDEPKDILSSPRPPLSMPPDPGRRHVARLALATALALLVMAGAFSLGVRRGVHRERHAEATRALAGLRASQNVNNPAVAEAIEQEPTAEKPAPARVAAAPATEKPRQPPVVITEVRPSAPAPSRTARRPQGPAPRPQAGAARPKPATTAPGNDARAATPPRLATAPATPPRRVATAPATPPPRPAVTQPVPAPAPEAAVAPTVAPEPPAHAPEPPAPRPDAKPARTAPRDTAPPDAEADRAEIRRVLDWYEETVRYQDLDTHMLLYAPRVNQWFRWSNVSATAIEREKQRQWDDVRRGSVRFGDPDIQFLTANRARVRFRKTWDFQARDRWRGALEGVMELRRMDGEWKIISERDLQVLWERRTR